MDKKTENLFTMALAVIVQDCIAHNFADYRAHADFEGLRRSINELRAACKQFYPD